MAHDILILWGLVIGILLWCLFTRVKPPCQRCLEWPWCQFPGSFCKAYSCLALCLHWLRCGYAAGWRSLTSSGCQWIYQYQVDQYPTFLQCGIEWYRIIHRHGGFQSIGVPLNQPFQLYIYMIGFSIINRSFWGSLIWRKPHISHVAVVIMVPSSSGLRLWGLHEHLCSWSNSHDQGYQMTAFASGNYVENHPWLKSSS